MKKLFAMLLALVMTMGLMACGAQPTAANDTGGDAAGEDAAVTEPANALEKIKADGVLTVALSPDFSPMV